MLLYKALQEIGSTLGIHKLGVSSSALIASDHIGEWLDRGYQGEMSYMARNQDKRLDPGKLLPGAKSVISVFVNYHQEEQYSHLDGVISKYARGVDYHKILKDMLHALADELHHDDNKGLTRKQRAKIYRIFVDSAPVMEKQWALMSGIGWQGKHSNIITRDYGSWGFLGEIITTKAFDRYDSPIPDYCGECTACLDACPTQAIVEPYVVDGTKCISYATIELKPESDFPESVKKDLGEWIFGCDICQDVCPWNRFAKPSEINSFTPLAELQQELPDFNKMSEIEFIETFGATPLERSGLAGLQRNIAVSHPAQK